MSGSTSAARLRAHLPRPRRRTVLAGLVLVNLEALFVAIYLTVTGRSYPLDFLLFPFVWINVGLWAILRTTPPPVPSRRRYVAGVLAVGYFLVLGYMGNMLAGGEAFGGNPAAGLDLVVYGAQPPGWTPYLLYNGTYVHVSLIPPYVVGFAALTYLVYATLLEASGLASVGLVGLFSCLSCTVPLLAAAAASAAGASSGVILSAVAPVAYEAGMVIFVLTVALLHWQPGMGWFARAGD